MGGLGKPVTGKIINICIITYGIGSTYRHHPSFNKKVPDSRAIAFVGIARRAIYRVLT